MTWGLQYHLLPCFLRPLTTLYIWSSQPLTMAGGARGSHSMGALGRLVGIDSQVHHPVIHMETVYNEEVPGRVWPFNTSGVQTSPSVLPPTCSLLVNTQ